MASPHLAALLALLGPDYAAQGYTDGPMPVVSIDAFFTGNDDDASFQGALLSEAEPGLRAIEAHEEVDSVWLGITQWDGEGAWPLAEYVFVVTDAAPQVVGAWFRQEGIHVSDIGRGNEHRPRAPIPGGESGDVVWAWID